jgi:RNA polymerase sigma factor (sigma-70 family)
MTRDQAARVVALLFEESYDSLTGYAYRHTGNLDTAEELVQDVLMALFVELRRGKTIQHPKAWSLVVLRRNICKARWKNHGALHQSLDDVEELAAVEDMPSAPEVDEFPKLLAHLTKREREVMLLRVESLKYREIAHILGISKNTVNALIARALKKLQALVRRKGVEGMLPARPMEKKSATTLQ